MDNATQAERDFASLRRVTDSTLCVRLSDLEETVRALAAVEDRLAGATRLVAGLDVSEAGDIAFDLRHFADHWEHGVTTLRRGVGALRTALHEVHEAYASHEHQLVEQLGGQP